MEKMNQVSVSEFMELTKPQMYDKAVEMVEKYNRLVDICNDGSERIADLVIERDNLSKGVQKLIGERDELIERHKVYTNALNKDIADKAAKIELLEKEIEGRKEGYWALKEKMDTQYISIDDHNDVCEDFKKKIIELKGVNIELNEKVKKRDKCIMEKNAIINTAAKMKEDDYGKSGFKRYIEHLIEEEERAVPERFKERLNEEITAIFTKEEEAEVNDIPCGEDAIE